MAKVAEKIKTRILCSVTFFFFFFSKIMPFMKQCRKIWCSQRGHKRLHNWPIRVAYWISKATCTHAHAHAHARRHTHTHPRIRPHARAHARIHTNMQYLLLLHGKNDSRTRLNVTLYVHCLSCLLLLESPEAKQRSRNISVGYTFIRCVINHSCITCSWLDKVYVLDYPCFSIFRALPSPPLRRLIEGTLYIDTLVTNNLPRYNIPPIYLHGHHCD
jgi:hypothetical protein